MGFTFLTSLVFLGMLVFFYTKILFAKSCIKTILYLLLFVFIFTADSSDMVVSVT